GSTAVEVGLKMAMQYWHNKGIHTKTKIIAFEGAYHGDTFGAMSVGARDIFNLAFNRYLFNVDFIEFPNKQNEEKILSEFRNLIRKGDVAAFIFEPLVQGAAGMRMYSPRILDQLISISNEYDVICIADEVFTGFGRTGRFFACDYLKNTPDIFALSKGITGGSLPLGATSCSSKIVSAFQSPESSRTLYHGHSYTANPIACAAANASFELLVSPRCKTAIETINKSFEIFKTELSDIPMIKEVRVCGTILAVELISDETSSYNNPIKKKIYSHFLSKGILIRPLGNIMYVVPPYIISEEELRFVQSEIALFLKDLFPVFRRP
ncbi:MAG: aminotransferase class III-fold pyridoxal phosphate-dependent enzyme, partial [Cyclobacteriaceae bacterium]|nr:aminotransferase class III-fold pyridoxal phosphate-dependent enzyme [Cyclobacteriaceae bacterium]